MKTPIQFHRSERGQAIVLVVLALVALMGFAALAVDGGQVYSERRRAQNAADASAYAAAMAAVEGGDPVQAAYDQASYNDYLISNVQVNHPPVGGEFAGDNSYYQVVITAQVQPAFASIVTSQAMQVKAEAVSHIDPVKAITTGNAIHALEDWGVAIEYKGNITVNVYGGNIFSNAGMTKKGGSGSITVFDGDILYSSGTCDGCTKGQVNPDPKPSGGPLYVTQLPTPACPGPAPAIDTTNNIMYPGTYSANIDFKGGKNKVPWTMKPGMYCLQSGMQINGNEEVIGKGVFIVMLGGEIRLNGGGKVKLSRPDDLTDANGNQWGGMLIYAPPSNPQQVFLSGNNETVFSGTILAPESWCSFGGNSDALGLNANIICNKILFHGNPTITVNYNQPQNFQLPPTLELSK